MKELQSKMVKLPFFTAKIMIFVALTQKLNNILYLASVGDPHLLLGVPGATLGLREAVPVDQLRTTRLMLTARVHQATWHIISGM